VSEPALDVPEPPPLVEAGPTESPAAAAEPERRPEPAPKRGRWLGILPRRPGPLGLRRRILMIFTLGALGLAAFLAFTTYGLVRSNLASQRDAASIEAAYRSSRLITGRLSDGEAETATTALEANGVDLYMLRFLDQWSGAAEVTEASIPSELRERVIDDGIDARMITELEGETVEVVGISLPSVNAQYFEFFSLNEDNETLSNVALSLLLAATITTGLGVLVGVLAARRAVRPVADASEAAKAIAGGRLDTRLMPTSDPDLGLLASSFNDMASALQQRVERDARFASDVSHELRSPLMTLSASIDVMEARRDEMPERAQAALDLLVSDVSRFRNLVEDLLEISRFDAGAIRLNLEDLRVAEFVRNAIAVSSAPTLEVTTSPRGENAIIRGDRRRLARVIANLIDNALAYGASDPEVSIEDGNPPNEPLTHVKIAVEDDGPGVPIEERALIFERFARGVSAGQRTGSEGAGLGLALVDEHIRLHDGRVWVEDRSDGGQGARFVIELPALPLDDLAAGGGHEDGEF
jgi:two-component system sensor histidine kinase MtrB